MRSDNVPGFVELELNGCSAGAEPAITIGPKAPLTETASPMLDKHVKRLPVVGEDGTLLGIVTVFQHPHLEVRVLGAPLQRCPGCRTRSQRARVTTRALSEGSHC